MRGLTVAVLLVLRLVSAGQVRMETPLKPLPKINSKITKISRSSIEKNTLNYSEIETKQEQTPLSIVLSSWGVLSVVTLIGNALKRLAQVAVQPIIQKDLTPLQIVVYILWCGFMMYVEGYKAFHLKFSPLVVKRSLTISQQPSVLNCILAGPYCIGLFGATKKRMIVSWSLMAGVFALVKLVKFLPYPWRSIVDAGVVCGLSFGTISIMYYYLRSLFGYPPLIDPELPGKVE